MAKKEQFTKEEHQRIKRQFDEISLNSKAKEELIRTVEAMKSPSELDYYQDLTQYLQDKNKTVSSEEKAFKELIDKYAQEIPEILKSKIKAQNNEKIDSTDALWSIADDMRQRKEDGEFKTYREAYRWTEKHMTHYGNPIKAYQLERAYHKAKAEDRVD